MHAQPPRAVAAADQMLVVFLLYSMLSAHGLNLDDASVGEEAALIKGRDSIRRLVGVAYVRSEQTARPRGYEIIQL